MMTDVLNGQSNANVSNPLVSKADQSQPAQGGVFIPRNGGIEGRIGKSNVFFSQGQGGRMSIVSGSWPKTDILAAIDMVFQLKKDGIDSPIEVRQSFDKNPKILFLEESL